MKAKLAQYLIATFLLFPLFYNPLYSQSVTNRDILTTPKIYLQPKRGQVTANRTFDVSERAPKSGGNLWIVFSDRDNNPTYSNSSGNSQFKSMQFLEAFYVIEENPQYVHLVKFDPRIRHPKRPWKIVGEGEDYGWAPKEKLLLWKFPMVNDMGFLVKAMAATKIEGMGEIVKVINAQKEFNFYNTPNLNSKNDKVIRFFQFLYILKETDNAVLVTTKGRDISVFENKANHVLGWIPKNLIEIWDQRVVLEPNTTFAAAEERKAKNIKATIFGRLDEAVAYKSDVASKKGSLLWNRDLFQERPSPEWKRLPILEKLPGGIIRTGVTTDLFSADGMVMFPSAELEELQRKKNEAESRYRNVNIVFVIDGTESMDPYFKSVASAVERSINQLKDNDIKYELGVVVYRDYPHRECPMGDRSLEVHDLVGQGQFESVVEFLRGVQTDEDCKDTNLPEAVYLGLRRALRMLEENHQKDQTNIVVLIGDTGNHRNDRENKIEDVIQQLVKMRCHFLAYQVAFFQPDTYQDFIDDARKLVNESSAAIGKGNPKFDPELERVGNTFKLNYPNFSPVKGEITYSRPNTPIKASELENKIFTFLDELSNQLMRNLLDIDRLIEGVGIKESQINAFVWDFLVNKMKLSKKELENVYKMDNAFQLYVQGYTPLEIDGLSHPVFQTMILLNNEELEGLRKQLSLVYNSFGQPVSNRRKAFVDAFKDILAAVYGKTEAQQRINKMSTQEIREAVLGLPVELNSLSGCPWPKKIPDVYKMPVEKFDQLTDCIRLKYDDLGRLPSVRLNELSFINFTERWYWIPDNLLP